VNGAFGLWLVGGPHVLRYEQRGRFAEIETRLAGNTLLWLAGGRTLRIEGELTRAQALRLARSLH
jgi:hypothetical protein